MPRKLAIIPSSSALTNSRCTVKRNCCKWWQTVTINGNTTIKQKGNKNGMETLLCLLYIPSHATTIKCTDNVFMCSPRWKGARGNVKSCEIQAIFCMNLALFLHALPPLIAGFPPICTNWRAQNGEKHVIGVKWHRKTEFCTIGRDTAGSLA